ncbi:MAG TPA: hypothetical protein VFL82_01030, partial [Thermomicrobiales bacterium]|nr:hypothetical protein [Thermomicrobiales bacterium]
YEACGGRCSMQGMMAAARTTRHILIEDEPKEGETLVQLEAGDSVVFDNDEPGIPPINLSLTNEGREQATVVVQWLRNGPEDSTPDPRKSPRS